MFRPDETMPQGSQEAEQAPQPQGSEEVYQASEQKGTHDQSLPTEGMEGPHQWYHYHQGTVVVEQTAQEQICPPTILHPPLRKAADSTDLAFSTEDKAEALKQAFFPPSKDANLDDLEGYQYPEPVPWEPLKEHEIVGAINSSHPNKAAGPKFDVGS